MTDRPQAAHPTNPASPSDPSQPSSRRDFLASSTTTLAGAAAFATASGLSVPLVHAAGSSTIKIGLVGCGGRGTGAAEEALKADSGTKLVAMADAFQDRIDNHLSTLKDLMASSSRIDVPKDRQYSGFDAYKNVIDQVDLVLLTTPPHFRPLHLAYAVEKGIHAFVEKPMAVDGPGLRNYLESLQGLPGQEPLSSQRFLLALRRPAPPDHEARNGRPDRRDRRDRNDL